MRESSKFRESFELKSRELLMTKKRDANLRVTVSDRLLKIMIKTFVAIIEGRLEDSGSDGGGGGELVEQNGSNKGDKLPRWQPVFRCLIAYLCLKQLLVALLQYKFDFLSFEYKRANVAYEIAAKRFARTSDGIRWQPFSMNLSSHLIKVQGQIERYEHTLKSLGAPFIRMTTLSECAIIFMIVCIVVYYVTPLLLCKLNGAISLLRMFTCETREWQNINRQIMDQVDEIICASKLNIVGQQQKRSTSLRYFGEKLLEYKSRGSSIANHNRTVRLLKQLALNGELYPENRMPEWISKISKLYVSSWIWFIVSDFLIIIPTPSLMDDMLGVKLEVGGVADFLSLCEYQVTALFALYLLHSWLHLYFFVFIDQHYCVGKLRAIVEDCIAASNPYPDQLCSRNIRGHSRRNKIEHSSSFSRRTPPSLLYEFLETGSYHFSSMTAKNRRANGIYYNNNNNNNNVAKACQQAIEGEKVEKMNENLLKLLAKYRIFVCQFKPLKAFFSKMSLYIQIFYVLVPLFIVVHVPYMSQRDSILFVAMLWSNVLSHDMAFISVCVYHDQYKQFHKRLYALLAQVDKVQEESSRDLPVYDPFVVSLIRREIYNTQLALKRVAIITFGKPLNYIQIVRVHFWASILSVHALFAYETRYANRVGDQSIFGFFL